MLALLLLLVMLHTYLFNFKFALHLKKLGFFVEVDDLELLFIQVLFGGAKIH
jgi:hypothetical protein